MPDVRPVAAIFFVLVLAGATAAAIGFADIDTGDNGESVLTVVTLTSEAWLLIAMGVCGLAAVAFLASVLPGSTSVGRRGRFR